MKGVALALVLLLSVGAAAERLAGFFTDSSRWNSGTTITMQMQLGGSETLLDGSNSWNQSATDALAIWNNHLDLVRFSAVQNSTAPIADRNGANNVVFSTTLFGRPFEEDVVAYATWWYSGGIRSEANVVFNSSKSWNSYRGSLRRSGTTTVFDLRRVALHEFGHVLGLNHPDDHGQSVSAIMNSTVSNLDALTADDVAGGRSLYGGGVTSSVSFPPRNEPTDFFNQLIGVYQNELRAGPVTTYVDPEGIVVWLTEYARYRVGLCDHATAQTRVFSAIDNTGVYGVCALTPAGSIPFPPRNEGLDFMNALQVKYRDDLRRGAGSSFVNNEGAVVWVLEYLRYRLNGCNHGDATTKVFAQIRGQGVQPVCR